MQNWTLDIQKDVQSTKRKLTKFTLTLILTNQSFNNFATSSFSKDSTSITWHLHKWFKNDSVSHNFTIYIKWQSSPDVNLHKRVKTFTSGKYCIQLQIEDRHQVHDQITKISKILVMIKLQIIQRTLCMKRFYLIRKLARLFFLLLRRLLRSKDTNQPSN